MASFGIVGDAFAPPLKIKRGVTLNKAQHVYPGYVMFGAQDGLAHVVAQDGTEVLSFASPIPDHNLFYPRPLDNGNILVTSRNPTGPERSMLELDQAGNIVWQFDQPAPYIFHHDQSRLPNGNTLIMCAQSIVVPSISPSAIDDDCVLEVDPAGNIVWAWHTWEHFDDLVLTPKVKEGIFNGGGDYLHANAAAAIPPNAHTDPAFAAGNIVISYRFINKIIIVSRTTGDIVWQTPSEFTLGQHDAEMLPLGLQGAGNIIVFDNGLGGLYANDGTNWRRNSRILEFDPTDLTPVWEWNATLLGKPDWWFDSWFVSSVQRLPNGNTLINEGAFGQFLEVNAAGQLAWSYVNPFLGPFGPTQLTSEFVYRAEKVDLDWLQP